MRSTFLPSGQVSRAIQGSSYPLPGFRLVSCYVPQLLDQAGRDGKCTLYFHYNPRNDNVDYAGLPVHDAILERPRPGH